MAWQLLFTSDIGLFSLFVIAFVVVMAVWFARFYQRKMIEDERRANAEAGGRTPTSNER